MPKKQIPDTSKEAFKSLNPEYLKEIYQKILKALDVIGSGTFQDISNYLCMEDSKVWKRLSELERMELIYRPGTKKALKSGRNGYIWFRTGKGMAKTDKENKRYEGKAIVDYSRRIQEISKQSKQLDLFVLHGIDQAKEEISQIEK